MADRAREPAICLQAIDFSETSQVVHLLTRDAGVVHLLAKGSKRPKSRIGRLDLLAEGEAVYIPPRGEKMGTLTEFAHKTSHNPLRRRLARLNAAIYMVEITRMLLAEADPHPPVFDLLVAALARLDREDAPPQAVLAYFQWRTLRHVGLLGEMDRCVGCGAAIPTVPAYFTSGEGGLLCRDCEPGQTEKWALTHKAHIGILALRAMDRRQPARLDEDGAAAVNDLLAYHISYQLGKAPKMLRHVRRQKP